MKTIAIILLLCTQCRATEMNFEDRWLTQIKPPPYSGLATRFDDSRAFDGKRIPKGQFICAHMLERIGQELRVTNIENGKSVVCRVADRGPNRRFWPRREVDLTPNADSAIGCDGMCKVKIERVAK